MKRRLIFSIFSLLFSITASAQKTDSAKVHFETAFEEINGMLTGKNPLSFKRAVFLSENAYLDNSLSYSAFDFSIKSAAHYCQRMAGNLPLNHPKEKPLGVNYAIFQHITDTTKHISGKDTFDFMPFSYDFEDFSGQKDWRKMFVTKLLRERTGNCRSLPYYYKLLADECGVEAFLALAPNHIYIKHRDVGQAKEGWQRRVYNIELTNGSFPMDGWLMASGYITLDAIRSGYYLDTLSQSQAVAMCLFDLAKGYERKFGKRDEFVSRCVERVLAIHPANINALLLKTELLKDRYERTKQPADYEAVEKHCSTLVANGYREMPLDMYLNWLFEVRAKGDAFVNVKRQPKKFDTQKGNPYKNDTTMKIYMQTLTDGRYDEFPEFAETTYVGSAVYDVYKKKIVGFIKRDTLYSEATLEPEVVSRWLSTDPVFHPYESPYTAFANNPVYFIDPNGTTEYPSSEEYKKANPKGKGDGSDGHWLTSDRNECTEIWKKANQVNIASSSGYRNYTTIQQRADFYDWFQGYTESKGFDTRWAGAANKVASDIATLDVVANTPLLGDYMFMGHQKEISAFANKGNRMIFEEVFPKLRDLVSGNPLKGDDAKKWDAQTLAEEQSLIQPLYTTFLSTYSSDRLEKMAQGANNLLFLAKISPLSNTDLFTGNLNNISHRWSYGMKGMNYSGTGILPSNMPAVNEKYKNGRMYMFYYNPAPGYLNPTKEWK